VNDGPPATDAGLAASDRRSDERQPAPVTVTGVSKDFLGSGGSVLRVLEDIDLRVEAGEFVAVVGPSGAGKTTLLNLLAGLESATTGAVTVLGGPPRPGKPEVGYLLARDALLPWRRVLANAELAMEMAKVPKAERHSRARALLAQVGLEEFEDAYPAQLSQGMRQRVAIARTLSVNPRVLLLDEPFSALDVQTKLLLQETFSTLWQQVGSTVILITHDLQEAIALADRVILFTARPGRVKAEYRVDLGRPRSILDLQGDVRFHRLYERVWAQLRDEIAGPA
jgi:NitT/TauT family transport system ATP-binding protein